MDSLCCWNCTIQTTSADDFNLSALSCLCKRWFNPAWKKPICNLNSKRSKLNSSALASGCLCKGENPTMAAQLQAPGLNPANNLESNQMQTNTWLHTWSQAYFKPGDHLQKYHLASMTKEGVLMITLVGRNGTACPYSYQQNLEKRTTAYMRRKCVSHTLSLQQPNLSTLHVNTLHFPVCGHEGNLVMEQAPERAIQHTCAILRWTHTWRTDLHQICRRLPEGPWPVGKQAPRALCMEGEDWILPTGHQTHQALLLSPQMVAAGEIFMASFSSGKSSRRGCTSH